eukprot:1985955-Karenia_brevis.AAC.1
MEVLTKGFIGLGEAIKSTSATMVMQGQQNIGHMMESNKIMMGGILEALNSWATEANACAKFESGIACGALYKASASPDLSQAAARPR